MQSSCAIRQNISHNKKKRLLHRFAVLLFTGPVRSVALLCARGHVEEIALFLCVFDLSRKEEPALLLCAIQSMCVEIFECNRSAGSSAGLLLCISSAAIKERQDVLTDKSSVNICIKSLNHSTYFQKWFPIKKLSGCKPIWIWFFFFLLNILIAFRKSNVIWVLIGEVVKETRTHPEWAHTNLCRGTHILLFACSLDWRWQTLWVNRYQHVRRWRTVAVCHHRWTLRNSVTCD